MTKYQLAVDIIKSSVSALDVADAFGWEVKHGRCRCPIHNGDGMNCRLYPGDRGYMCWVCKSAGDVIKLVREYQQRSFKDAVCWFNDTFHLGLDLDRKIDPEEAKRAEIALQARKEAREYEEWKKRMSFDMALTADQIVRRLELVRDANVPKTADEEWNASFRMAVELLPEAQRFAEDCAMMCIEEKKD